MKTAVRFVRAGALVAPAPRKSRFRPSGGQLALAFAFESRTPPAPQKPAPADKPTLSAEPCAPAPELPAAPGAVSRRLHVAHCCERHGCNYADPDCPVEAEQVGQASRCGTAAPCRTEPARARRLPPRAILPAPAAPRPLYEAPRRRDQLSRLSAGRIAFQKGGGR